MKHGKPKTKKIIKNNVTLPQYIPSTLTRLLLILELYVLIFTDWSRESKYKTVCNCLSKLLQVTNNKYKKSLLFTPHIKIIIVNSNTSIIKFTVFISIPNTNLKIIISQYSIIKCIVIYDVYMENIGFTIILWLRGGFLATYLNVLNPYR